MPIRLIHFSDLHLSLIDDENVINLVHEMTQTLLKLSVQHSIDLIIFTGDMIDRGGKNFQTISEAFECFKKIVMDPICEKLSIPSTHFIIIPGNHDTKTTQKELNDKKIYLMNNAINSYNDVIKMKNTQEAYYKDSWVSRIKAFKDFERKVYKCSTKEFNSTDFESNWIIKSNDGIKLGISSFNSVWLCDLTDESNFLGIDQISRSQSFLDDCEIKIAASHYHYDRLHEVERTITRDMLAKKYDLFLSGHSHSSNTEFRQESDHNNYFLDLSSAGVLSANSFEINPQYKNSFYVIDIYSQEHFDIMKYVQVKGLNFEKDLSFGEMGILSKMYNKSYVNALEESQAKLEEEKKNKKLLEEIKPFRPICIADKEGAFNKIKDGEFKSTLYIKDIQDNLLKRDKKLVLISGMSGVGKTRIVYETYKESKDVYYLPYSCEYNDISNLTIRLNSGVIIIDNATNNDIINSKKIIDNCSKPFQIILIINSADKNDFLPIREGEYLIDNEKSQGIVDAIVDESQIHDTVVKSKIKEYAGSIPLLAKELIEVYIKGGNINIMPGKDDCFMQIINPNGQLKTEGLYALYTIAAFIPFGYKDKGKDYFEFIINHPCFHRIAKETETIRVCFENLIRDFINIGLFDIRAGGYIDIRAWPLANWLSLKWFNMIPSETWPELIKIIESKDIGKMVGIHLSNRLKWLDNEEAKILADKLNKNSFHNEAVAFTQMGSELLSSMAVVNPCSVATNLYLLLENQDYKDISVKISGDIRRNIVWTLETCSANSQAFFESSIALAILAIGENENYGNNATGVFLQLFHVVLSGTEASLASKINVLNYLKNKAVIFNTLIVKAINSALETRHLHRIITSAERIKGEINDCSASTSDLVQYWRECINILKSISSTKEILDEIRNFIPNHVYDLISYNCIDELYDLFIYYAPLYNYDWLEMREAIMWIKNYRESYFQLYKSKFEEMIKLLAPKSYKKAVETAVKEVNRKAYGNDIAQAYLETMKPFAEQFAKMKIWEEKDFSDMADDDNFHGIWLSKSIMSYIDKYGYRDEFYTAMENYILSKETNYKSKFILSIITADSNVEYTKRTMIKLLEMQFYEMASALMGFIDDKTLYYFGKLSQMIESGICNVSLLNNYEQYYRYNTWDNIIKINDIMYQNKAIDISLVINHLEMYGIDKNDLEKYATNIEVKLLDYPFDEKHINNSARSFVYLVEKMLSQFDNPDFAIKIHNKIVEYLNSKYTSIPHCIEELYAILLPKYQNVLLDKILSYLANPNYLLYSYSAAYILGSGFDFNLNEGILFQCDNNKIKQACLQYQETLPPIIARMCPVYNYNNETKVKEISDIAIWLIDNFGNNHIVLENLEHNFSSFSYCGTGSMAPFFEERKKIFEPLLKHKNQNVVKWATRIHKFEDYREKNEKDKDEYNQMMFRLQ